MCCLKWSPNDKIIYLRVLQRCQVTFLEEKQIAILVSDMGDTVCFFIDISGKMDCWVIDVFGGC